MQEDQLCARRDAQQRIEIRERLVEQKGLRFADDRPAQRDALALAAGQLRRPAIEDGAELERRSGALHALVDARRIEAAHAEPERQVLAHALVRVERVALEHHREVALLRRHAG